jgi:DNA-binding GntR family transcriptional regulator/transposase
MRGTDDDALQRALDSTDRTVRRRARFVAAALADGTAAAAARYGVSQRTVSAWVRRYREDGGRVLTAEADRRQRRAELERTIRMAPLSSPSAKWSSRSIAQDLGVSQSAVARAWRAPSPPRRLLDRIGTWAGDGSVSIVSVLVAPGSSVVVLARSAVPRARSTSSLTRIGRRVRTLLAADLTRDRIVEDVDSDEVAEGFWARALATTSDPADLLVVSSTPVALGTAAVEAHACPEGDRWQGMLGPLVALCGEGEAQALADLETRIRRWHHHENGVFIWHSQEAEPIAASAQRASTRSDGAAVESAPGHSLEDSIIALIRGEILAGRYAGGDFVTERFLANRLGVSRGWVRDALRTLTMNGLATTQTLHGMTIPIPTVEDVVELYSARRALGAIAVLRTLEDLDAAAQADDMTAAHQIDLQFQDALARSSSLRRIPAMVEGLSQQLLMFVAVFGVRYAHPIADIIERDQEIFRALDAGDEAAALEGWRKKAEGSAAYMLHQLRTTLRQRS